jgi:hypothetical protein
LGEECGEGETVNTDEVVLCLTTEECADIYKLNDSVCSIREEEIKCLLCWVVELNTISLGLLWVKRIHC